MKTEILDAQQWAKKTFGSCQLKDLRRSLRAVKAATRMAENPSASLPAQQVGWKEVVALYRLMNEADVSFEALMHPDWQQTYEQLAAPRVVLLVQDTTELDLTSHAKMTGLGQIGNEGGRGLHLQTMLAVLPQSREVLGCAKPGSLCAHSCSQGRATLPATQTSRTGNRCLDAAGRAAWLSWDREHLGACGGSHSGYVRLFYCLCGHSHPVSGPCRPEPSSPRSRNGIPAGSGALLAGECVPSF